MKFIPSKIPDVIMIEPKVFQDARGFFYESYNKKIFYENGIRSEFVQDNQSSSGKGILRGIHYQTAPRAQAKLVWVTKGVAFDVAVDLRERSKTFCQYVSEILSADNKKMFYIPKGCAHGFQTLTDDCEVEYFMSQFYSPEHGAGVRWDDSLLKISWPIKNPILSKQDKKWPLLLK